MKTRDASFRFRHGLTSVVLASIFLLFASSSGPQDVPGVDDKPGISSTLLPDGSRLLIGGDSSGGPSVTAAIWDPASGGLSAVGSLNHARSWHTATLLPDGTVLVFGGFDRMANSLLRPSFTIPTRTAFT
jgi:hypothetical protein